MQQAQVEANDAELYGARNQRDCGQTCVVLEQLAAAGTGVRVPGRAPGTGKCRTSVPNGN
eukprot:3931786-Rhodomonas_salina.1